MELHKMVQNYLPANKEYPWENRKDMKRAEQLLWEYSGGGRCELDKLMRRMIENDRRMEQKKAQDEERWRERENFNTEKDFSLRAVLCGVCSNTLDCGKTNFHRLQLWRLWNKSCGEEACSIWNMN